MPKKNPGMTPEEQSKRFVEAANEADGGESPPDAAERFDKTFRELIPEKRPKSKQLRRCMFRPNPM